MSIGVGVGVGIAFSQAPAAASFDPNFNLIGDPGFDNAGVWTVTGTGCDVNTTTPSAFHLGFRNGTASIVAAATLAAGTYRFKGTRTTYQSGNGAAEGFKVTIGGQISAVTSGAQNADGTVQVTIDNIVVTSVTDQNIIIVGANTSLRDLWDMTDCELKRLS